MAVPLREKRPDHGPYHYSFPGNSLQPSVGAASVRRGLIFSPGRFIIKQSFTRWLLNQAVMPPLQDSLDDHRQRKISWKYHFQTKPDIILPEKIIQGSSMNALKEVPGGVLRLLGPESLWAPADDLKIAIDHCPDFQPSPVAPGATSIDHD